MQQQHYIFFQVYYISKDKLFFYDVNKKTATHIRRRYHIRELESVDALFRDCDVIILAIKPQTLPKLELSVLKKVLRTKLVISILAGTKSETIKNKLLNNFRKFIQ